MTSSGRPKESPAGPRRRLLQRPADTDAFAEALLSWFAAHGRHDLPWQLDRDPYRVWVSEIMLQQTQVVTVIPYYRKFVARFPDVATLADAPLDDVLSHWAGLGYYARARHLHKAAIEVRDHHQGEIPRSLESLTALPGIGRSTAAAILALAWDEPHAILDGNVKRVLARFHAVRGWPGKADVLASLWSLAERHTPRRRAAEYTQAIMDLGATVCVRSRPRCAVCPVASGCGALAGGIVAELPTPRPKRAKPRRSVRVAVVRTDAHELLLERRPPAGIWGGLMSLPEIPDPGGSDSRSPAEWCRDTLGLTAIETGRLSPIEHSFTHFDLTLTPVVLHVAASATEAPERASGVLDANRWLWYNTAGPPPGGMAAPIAKLVRTLAAARGSDEGLRKGREKGDVTTEGEQAA